MMLATTARKDLLSGLCELTESTTNFLETFCNSPLQVKILSQQLAANAQRPLMQRSTILYFNAFERPILYCLSELFVEEITEQEMDALRQSIPIGKIFIRYNPGQTIKKINASVTEVSNLDDVAMQLRLPPGNIYHKQYDYIVGNRTIGHISEFFTQESLMRI